LEADFRGQIPHITISLYEDPERERFVRKRETEERLSSVFLSLVFCFVFFVRFIRTDRDIIYKREFVLGKNPRFSVKVRFLFSCSCLVYRVSLFLCVYIRLKRERENDASVVIVLVSSVLDSLLFSLFFCRCSFPLKSLVSKDQERELAATLGRRTATVKATTTLSFSPFREEFISRWCSIRSGVQN